MDAFRCKDRLRFTEVFLCSDVFFFSFRGREAFRRNDFFFLTDAFRCNDSFRLAGNGFRNVGLGASRNSGRNDGNTSNGTIVSSSSKRGESSILGNGSNVSSSRK
jgi:hypothetical protein